MRTHVAKIAMALALLMQFEAQAAGAARKNTPASKAKVDPVAALAMMQAANQYRAGENLAEACRRSNFRGLAIALAMNSSWLTSAKREF